MYTLFEIFHQFMALVAIIGALALGLLLLCILVLAARVLWDELRPPK